MRMLIKEDHRKCRKNRERKTGPISPLVGQPGVITTQRHSGHALKKSATRCERETVARNPIARVKTSTTPSDAYPNGLYHEIPAGRRRCLGVGAGSEGGQTPGDRLYAGGGAI